MAVELPTGSGKTLVGTLIGEYRRRAMGERVAFLCPNKQLCCQAEGEPLVQIDFESLAPNTLDR